MYFQYNFPRIHIRFRHFPDRDDPKQKLSSKALLEVAMARHSQTV
jgi:hypothetical protein